ncbi:hypothetical protein FRX31_029557 [Thalictrum thalictroides]|uniref:Uncharacterized protein n=1 Tax=Thalictrum thalictroides TaxID=46969 RepID=A0A7J6V750_THATH|nr:hypothetical protein FRX31_029557 [Thalictrum thalictroides]
MGIAGNNGNNNSAHLRLSIDDRSPNSKGKGIEIAVGMGSPNYVGSATGHHGLEQFRIDNLNGNYGLHSPKEKDDNNRNLIMLLQGQQMQIAQRHNLRKKTGVAVWIEKKESKVVEETVIASTSVVPSIPTKEQPPCSKKSDNEGEVQEDDWEIPKKRHTCRVRVETHGTTSKEGQQEDDKRSEDIQGLTEHVRPSKNGQSPRDARQDNNYSKEVALGQGLGPPI